MTWRGMQVTPLIARLIVTLALLAWAFTDLLLNPSAQDHSASLTIIGAVIGYWLGHADLATSMGNGNKPNGSSDQKGPPHD